LESSHFQPYHIAIERYWFYQHGGRSMRMLRKLTSLSHPSRLNKEDVLGAKKNLFGRQFHQACAVEIRLNEQSVQYLEPSTHTVNTKLFCLNIGRNQIAHQYLYMRGFG